MQSNTKKRKSRQEHPNRKYIRQDPDPSLFIQAHEADIRRGHQAQELAKSLEVLHYTEEGVKTDIGNALIQWLGGSHSDVIFDDDEDTIHLGVIQSKSEEKVDQSKSGVWVDRYDARLLLDALPEWTGSVHTEERPSFPSGWSDIPSDTEDTFFLTPGEEEDFRNDKRRRILEEAREERVKARLQEEKEDEVDVVDDDPWGDSDEEPDDAQKELMCRTAAHMLSTGNPAQLEMRILANHGADKRFAFLKGRWKNYWRLTRYKLKKEKEEKENKEKREKQPVGLGLLAGYESDSDSDNNDKTDNQTNYEPKEEIDQREDEKKKELRRKKAKEWAEQRRNQSKS